VARMAFLRTLYRRQGNCCCQGAQSQNRTCGPRIQLFGSFCHSGTGGGSCARQPAYVQAFVPPLWALLDGLDAGLRPWLIRGDVGFGNEPVMREAERRHQPYLFKLRLTKGVKRAAAIDRHRHVRSASTRARCVVGGSRCGDTGSSPQAATGHPCPASAQAFCQSCSPIARSTARRRLAIM
jgi:hypothetical protein